MPTSTWNLEWLNHNSQRKFPLAGDATVTDQSGSFTLPDDFIVGFDLPINAAVNAAPSQFFLMQISSGPNGYKLVIGYQPTVGDAVIVASVSFPAAVHTRNAEYRVGGIGDFADSRGSIVVGRLDNIGLQPPGVWNFDLAATRFESRAVRPILRSVTSITCVNAGQKSIPLQGNIELRAGPNMQILPVFTEGEDPVIIFSAINGEGTVDACVCTGDEAPADPILTINGNPPSSLSDFSILGDTCIQVTSIANGIQIANACAQPCCGPVELERLTRDLVRMGQEEETVKMFVDQMMATVTSMNQMVLGTPPPNPSCP